MGTILSQEQMLLVGIMVAIPCIGIVFTLYMRSMLNAFRQKTRFIETRNQLTSFRHLVGAAMYGSLFQISLLFVPLLVFLYGLADGILGLPYVLVVVVPSGIYLLIYVRYKRLEQRVQAIGMDNQELLQEFIHIVSTWRKKSLPKW
ncbi:MAG: hypothetical protein IID08_04235 [Candidatus Hydrogenedentes bacterium]|nr:hypothetical protein [Candidatus Hydrogenedentota bacterium]